MPPLSSRRLPSLIHTRSLLVLLLACLGPVRAFSQTAPNSAHPPSTAHQTIASEADLPRFSYPLATAPSELLHADAAAFDIFAGQVEADLHRTLADCQITDQVTQRALLEPLFYLALLAGQDDTARQLLPQLQANEQKEARRLTTWRVETAYLQAAHAAGTRTGLEFAGAFETADRTLIDTLPWDAVQEVLRQEQGERKALLANGREPADRTRQRAGRPRVCEDGYSRLAHGAVADPGAGGAPLGTDLVETGCPNLEGVHGRAHDATRPLGRT